MEYASIYVVLSFLLSEFYNFLHIEFAHTLLDLYLSVSFWGGANVNGVVFFKFQILLIYCWYIRKQVTFVY